MTHPESEYLRELAGIKQFHEDRNWTADSAFSGLPFADGPLITDAKQPCELRLSQSRTVANGFELAGGHLNRALFLGRRPMHCVNGVHRGVLRLKITALKAAVVLEEISAGILADVESSVDRHCSVLPSQVAQSAVEKQDIIQDHWACQL